MIRGVIFDMDGTLFDTERLYTIAWKQVGEARDGVPKKKGLMDLLSYLEEKKIPAAVATSTRQSRGEKVLQMSGIAEYFAAFIYGDTQKASKPKPDIFWNAAKAIGRDPKECLVVEDSTPGVMAGIAAGGETIYIHDMVDVPEEVLEHASASLEDLGQIIEWLENVK